MAKLPHARYINGKLHLRVDHGLSKARAGKKAKQLRRKGIGARVIPEGGKYSVFRRVR